MQESHTETKSPLLPTPRSAGGDQGKNFSKDREVDECEDVIDENEVKTYSVEKFRVDGKHFSHRHPLSLTKDKQVDDNEDEKEYLCRLCGLPILSTPSYTCTVGCKIFLHQQCALKFLPRFIHPTHYGPTRIRRRERHTFHITKGSSYPNFTYKCEDCNIEEVHPLVAVVPSVEIKIRHNSHPLHPLVAICKEISCKCDACGRKQDGFFLSCQECNFWIHQDCTILPNTITLLDHPYPFIIAYALPKEFTEDDCVICLKPLIDMHNGVYFCPQSITFAHLTCGMDKCAASKTRLELIQLPDDEWDTFPTWAIRTYTERKDDDDDDDKLTIRKYHNHPLILTQLTTTIKPCNLACDLCTQPINYMISSQFYKCQNCEFVAHNICADILPILKFNLPGFNDKNDHRAKIHPNPSASFFSSIFYCPFCHRPCNGLCYHFPASEVCMDLECMVAPCTVSHASHPQHLLFRSLRVHDVYSCIACKYFIHIKCAMLPKRMLYLEYHHHPLHLVFTTHADVCCFCEVCEKDIDLNYWMYRCDDCEQSFHINCIPSVGHLSKVKFEGEVSVPDCHIHPLTLTRMLTVPSQRCGHCKQMIRGLVDEMALVCSQCHFWLHFACARDSIARNTSNPLKLYSKMDEEYVLRITTLNNEALNEE